MMKKAQKKTPWSANQKVLAIIGTITHFNYNIPALKSNEGGVA